MCGVHCADSPSLSKFIDGMIPASDDHHPSWPHFLGVDFLFGFFGREHRNQPNDALCYAASWSMPSNRRPLDSLATSFPEADSSNNLSPKTNASAFSLRLWAFGVGLCGSVILWCSNCRLCVGPRELYAPTSLPKPVQYRLPTSSSWGNSRTFARQMSTWDATPWRNPQRKNLVRRKSLGRDPKKATNPSLETALPETSGTLLRSDPLGLQFSTWAKDAGVQTFKIALATFDGLDGVMATESIHTSDLLISIPLTSLIRSTEDAEPNPLPSVSDAFWKEAHYTTRLALKLLAEQKTGPQSPFWGYFSAVLPTAYSTPFFWTEERLEALQYPPTADAVQQQRAEWRAIHRKLGATSPAFPCDWEEFVGAMSAVRSRSFRGDIGGLWGDRGLSHCMLPWVDMINSRSGTPTSITFSFFKQRLELFAGEDVAEGQQVWISYEKPNDDLLQFYGYVEEDNPYDVFDMPGMAQMVVDEGSLTPDMLQRRLSEIRSAGLTEFVEHVYVTKGGAYLKTMQAIRMLLAPAGEDAMVYKDREASDSERKVYEAIRRLAMATKAQWPTSLEEDVDALRKPMAYEDELVVRYRVEKKKILLGFIRRVGTIL